MLDHDAVDITAEHVDIIAAVYDTERVALPVIGCTELLAIILIADTGASENYEDNDYANEDNE